MFWRSKKILKHKKVRHIEYSSLTMQPYLRSPILQHGEAQVVAALRSKCVKSVKSNFGKMFQNRIHCCLLCDKEKPHVDTQEHLLICKQIKYTNENYLTISAVYRSLSDQKNIGRLVAKCIREKKLLTLYRQIMNYQSQITSQMRPWAGVGTHNCAMVCSIAAPLPPHPRTWNHGA